MFNIKKVVEVSGLDIKKQSLGKLLVESTQAQPSPNNNIIN